ncbi:MAG: HAD-IA family hydrolase [Candidatus Shapirobacteria bacterium]
MKITDVIFDFDGTIVDTFDLSIKIFNEVSGEFNFREITDKEVKKWKDFGIKKILKEVNISIFKLPKIISRVQEIQTERIDEVVVFDGVLKVMKELQDRGYGLGILTSNSKANVEFFFNKHKFKGIKYIYSGNSLFGKDKLIKKLLKKNDLKKEQVIYLGDEIRDVESCQKAGIKIIAVSWGYNSKKALEGSKPNYLVDKPKEILDILN